MREAFADVAMERAAGKRDLWQQIARLRTEALRSVRGAAPGAWVFESIADIPKHRQFDDLR
ncbi:MAG: hypothetical protein WCI05_14125 [Myxococcales bacterium]|jgi:hypothetical protein